MNNRCMDTADYTQAIARWHDFYMLTGGAAATLIGLIFVALSFGIGVEQSQRPTDGVNTFVKPAMVHFVIVLIIAATSVAPVPRQLLVLVLATMVLLNLAPGVRRVQKLREFHRLDPFDWSDWLWYLLLPLACQLLLVFAATRIYLGHADAMLAVAAALVTLLVSGVRNAWELVLYLIQKR